MILILALYLSATGSISIASGQVQTTSKQALCLGYSYCSSALAVVKEQIILLILRRFYTDLEDLI